MRFSGGHVEAATYDAGDDEDKVMAAKPSPEDIDDEDEVIQPPRSPVPWGLESRVQASGIAASYLAL